MVFLRYVRYWRKETPCLIAVYYYRMLTESAEENPFLHKRTFDIFQETHSRRGAAFALTFAAEGGGSRVVGGVQFVMDRGRVKGRRRQSRAEAREEANVKIFRQI